MLRCVSDPTPLMVGIESLVCPVGRLQSRERRRSLQGLTHRPPTPHLLQPDTLPSTQQCQNANMEARGPRHRCRAADISSTHPLLAAASWHILDRAQGPTCTEAVASTIMT